MYRINLERDRISIPRRTMTLEANPIASRHRRPCLLDIVDHCWPRKTRPHGDSPKVTLSGLSGSDPHYWRNITFTVKTLLTVSSSYPSRKLRPEQQRLGPSSHILDKRSPVSETRPSLVPQEQRGNASPLARRSHLYRGSTDPDGGVPMTLTMLANASATSPASERSGSSRFRFL
jgi:hypothetical protein